MVTDPDPLPLPAALAQIAAVDWSDTGWWARWQQSLAEAAAHNASLAARAAKAPPTKRKSKPTLDLKG